MSTNRCRLCGEHKLSLDHERTCVSCVSKWTRWKAHLIVCVECTEGEEECPEGHAILGKSTSDDAPWLRNISPR